MTGIHSIEICNFKYAKGVVPLHLNGYNALIYGENGSGKSTIFWALHAFLESAFKEKKAVEKYFIPGGDESLVNLYMEESEETYIELTFTDDPSQKYRFSKDIIDTNNSIIRETCYAAELINHRFLSRVYDQRNSQPLDVFPLFSKDIFPYIRYENHSIGDIWREIVDNPPVKMNRSTKEYKLYTQKVDTFNSMLK